MATYRYKARSTDGTILEGQLLGRSAESVTAILTAACLTPLSVVMVTRTNVSGAAVTLGRDRVNYAADEVMPSAATDARVRPRRTASGGWTTAPTWFDKLCARLRHIFLVDKSNKQLM